jgi:hypothetical protein
VSALPDALRAALEPLVVAEAVVDPSRG